MKTLSLSTTRLRVSRLHVSSTAKFQVCRACQQGSFGNVGWPLPPWVWCWLMSSIEALHLALWQDHDICWGPPSPIPTSSAMLKLWLALLRPPSSLPCPKFEFKRDQAFGFPSYLFVSTPVNKHWRSSMIYDRCVLTWSALSCNNKGHKSFLLVACNVGPPTRSSGPSQL